MKVPCRWLADYVDIEITADAVARLAEQLTLAGLEVEGIDRTGSLRGVVVGQIASCRPHPDSDHLTTCVVDVGERTRDIVCGAPNVVEGAYVPVATVGALLPTGTEVEKKRIRGKVSDGMICSKKELGLEDQSEGIWVFDPKLNLSVGTDLTGLLEYDDLVFDIKVASNRPDCASVYGVAREVSAILDRPLRPLVIDVDESPPSTSSMVQIEIEDSTDTPRYAARVMEGVQIGPSPLRTQHRLIKAGMRPLSNVVDATNYAMLELGYPLHPFDADLLKGTITIRRARNGELLRTLDGIARTLTTEALLIVDEEGPIALAGVMGGERSEIRPETSRVLLEIASFDNYTIRRSSRSIGLRSEASQRFERGIDPQGVAVAAHRAAYWLQQLTGCRVLEGLSDEYPAAARSRRIRFRPTRAAAVLGIDVNRGEILDIFRRLEIEANADGDEIVATIPHFRPDLEREIDLVEEVGRVHGYDRLPKIPPRSVLRVGRKDAIERGKDRIREVLVGLGLCEIIDDGFDKRAWREAFGLPEDDLVNIRNPMAATQSALRSNLLPGVLTVIETNLNSGVAGGRIFELGRAFSLKDGERERLAGALFGRTGIPLRGKELVSLGEAKGVLDSLFDQLRLDHVEVEAGDLPAHLHPGRSARFVRRGEEIGHFGELAPALVDRFPIPTTVLVFELDVSALMTEAEASVVFAPLPRFPASKRDLSLSAPVEVPEAKIRELLRSEPTVESVLLYDLYLGEQVAAGRKSLTYEIAFRAAERTLTDVEVTESLGRIEVRLREMDVHLRG
jgi:phenylalanyl-tRNA synthetase beta chain